MSPGRSSLVVKAMVTDRHPPTVRAPCQLRETDRSVAGHGVLFVD